MNTKLEMSWYHKDPESNIYDVSVGLSSTHNGEADIMPFTSTEGHRHFVTYSTGLSDGARFYINLKVLNKAGHETKQVF